MHAVAVVGRVVADVIVVIFVLDLARSPVLVGTSDGRNVEVKKAFCFALAFLLLFFRLSGFELTAFESRQKMYKRPRLRLKKVF